MFYFTVGAVFKNEAHIMKEWIEHYALHGADHIYLINDNSTDQFLDILQPYIDKKYVTLYNNTLVFENVGRQTVLYNYFFQKHLKETQWFGIFDLDEFLYSPHEVNVKNVLRDYENAKQLQVNWVHFGSSGHIKQPDNVVNNFLYRGEYNSLTNGPDGRYNSYKSIVNTFNSANIQLNIHSHGREATNVSFQEKDPKLLVNHYAIQSVEFWQKVKMTRGDINKYYDSMAWQRNMQLFSDCDRNTNILDERLKIQNSR
jgi:hypothetical protein